MGRGLVGLSVFEQLYMAFPMNNQIQIGRLQIVEADLPIKETLHRETVAMLRSLKAASICNINME